MRFGRRIDPLILASAIVSFFLAIDGDPWWSVVGVGSNQILTVQVSPYYFQTFATGLAPVLTFLGAIGSLTRVLLILSFVALAATGVRSSSWWREIAVYFSLSAISELYLSFLLMYHYAETLFLGTYGILLPSSGVSRLPAVLVGIGLASYANPLVNAGFTLPFYLGFVSLGLIGASQVFNSITRRKVQTRRKGVAAIFTQE